jgi:hypothetical protein
MCALPSPAQPSTSLYPPTQTLPLTHFALPFPLVLYSTCVHSPRQIPPSTYYPTHSTLHTPPPYHYLHFTTTTSTYYYGGHHHTLLLLLPPTTALPLLLTYYYASPPKSSLFYFSLTKTLPHTVYALHTRFLPLSTLLRRYVIPLISFNRFWPQ